MSSYRAARAGRLPIFAILTVVSLCLLNPGTAAAQGQQSSRVAGTGVALIPPAGFQPATQFPGFEHKEASSSIMVTEVSGPAVEMQAGLNANALGSRGMTLISSEPATFGDLPGVLLAVTQSAGGVAYRKWMGVFGTAEKTLVIVATFPATQSDDFTERMKKAVLSATWTASPADLFEGLPYRVKETNSLKVSSRLANSIILTKDAAGPPSPPEEPFLIVVSAAVTGAVEDQDAFARARLAEITRISGLHDLKGAPAAVGGLRGYEMTGLANDISSGAALVVYQATVVRRGAYYQVLGLVGTSQASRYLAEFKEVAAGLSFVD